MPTSQKKIEANRGNAQKSTGPKSDAGKSASAQNARKHGLLAQTVVAKHENREEFIALLNQLFEEFSPQPAVEEQLVEQLAMAFWRNRRLAVAERLAMEGEIVDHEKFDFGLVARDGETLRQASGVLEIGRSLLFGRYQVMITNEIRRILSMIHEEQGLRLKTIDGVAAIEVIEGGGSSN